MPAPKSTVAAITGRSPPRSTSRVMSRAALCGAGAWTGTTPRSSMSVVKARETSANPAEAIEERAHRRAEPHAHRQPAAEHEPDGELVAAERAHEEREEEEHAHAHPAREVDGARDPEGARVEPRGGVHARGRSGVGSGGRRRMREIVDGIFTWSW